MENKQGIVTLQQAKEAKAATNGSEVTPIDPISMNVPPTVRPVYHRQWRDEPLGRYDRQVDIWWNGKWVPGFFSDIRAGDFFLDINMKTLEPGRCFAAAEAPTRSGDPANPTFMLRGAQITQAPATQEIKDINQIEGGNNEVPQLAAPAAAKRLLPP